MSDFGARFLIAVAIEGWVKDHLLTLSDEVTGELQDAIVSIMQADIESGVGRIIIERRRQIEVKGYTPEHDDEHDLGELGLAAALYALPYDAQVGNERLLKQDDFIGLHIALETGCGFYIDPDLDPVTRLAKAGALCAAEIDRLNRREQGKLRVGKREFPRSCAWTWFADGDHGGYWIADCKGDEEIALLHENARCCTFCGKGLIVKGQEGYEYTSRG